ncbi:hypothetical protein ACDQ55_21610 [Chitinophaga sp. 30R24]|uniref:hypothetical protein n=1 Tax=Chitinophaga sp. 30R24 TaxID=3248838 RepID=UPI003B9045BF
MKSRTIVVPKDSGAEHALNYDEATPDQLIEVELNEVEFKDLWETGFFEFINSIADANIDNYEDESIVEREKLKKVLSSDIFTRNIIANTVNQIRYLFEEAIKRETGIYFYF